MTSVSLSLLFLALSGDAFAVGPSAREIRKSAEERFPLAISATPVANAAELEAEPGLSESMAAPDLQLRFANPRNDRGIRDGRWIVYEGAYPGVDVLRTFVKDAEWQVLIMADRAAAERVEYQIVGGLSAMQLVREGRGVRFLRHPGDPREDVSLSPPLVVDSIGRPTPFARWEIVQAGANAHVIRLRVDDEHLQYPISLVSTLRVIERDKGAGRIGAGARLQPIPTATGDLSGRVTVQGTGAAIGNAFVYAFDDSLDFETFTTTDANGDYSLSVEAGPHRLVFAAEGYATELFDNIPCAAGACDLLDGTVVTVSAGTSTPNINAGLIADGSVLSGVVRSASGTGLQGVGVLITDSANRPLAYSVSDSAGAFRFEFAAGGTFYAQTRNGAFPGFIDQVYSGADCSPCNASQGTPIVLGTGASRNDINFFLKPNGGRISGRLMDAVTLSPIRRQSVVVYTSGGLPASFGLVDENGSYETFQGLISGSYFVVTAAAGYHQQLYDGFSCAAGCNVTSGTPVPVVLGSTTPNIDFNLVSENTRIKGVVRNGSNALPLGQVRVVAHDASGTPVRFTFSSAFSGGYEISVPSVGSYFVGTQNDTHAGFVDQLYSGIDCTGCAPVTGQVIAADPGSLVQDVDFALKPNGGRIAGSVIDDADDTPIKAALVSFFNSAGVLVSHATTDISGSFTNFHGLTSGSYYAIATAKGYAETLHSAVPCAGGCDPTQGTAIPVTLGETTAGVTIRLNTSGPRLSGRVVAASTGDPLPGVDINVYDAGGTPVAADVTDSNGQYLVALPEPGTYYALAINNAYPQYLDQLYDHLACNDCDPTTGTPLTVAAGSLTSNVNFDLTTATCSATIQPASLPGGEVGTPYLEVVTMADAIGAPTFSIASGSLPGGLALDATDGVISGNPTTAGSFTFTIRGTDANSCIASREFTIVMTTATTTTLSASATTAPFGTGLAFTAQVMPSTATGTVELLDGSTVLETALLANGQATWLISSLATGTHTLTARYAGTAIFLPSVSGPIVVTIQKATPTITWPTPDPIVYGTALSGAQLNATASVPGTFVYTPAAGTLLDAGTHALQVSFTPTDQTNYNSAAAGVSLVVQRATPVFSSLSEPVIIVGTPSTPVSGTLSAGALIPGGSVTIALAGMSLDAAIGADGTFQATFATGSLPPITPGYEIAFTYPGSTNFNPAAATSQLVVRFAFTGGAQRSPVNSGSAVPISIKVVNAEGHNLSAPTLAVLVHGLRLVGSATWNLVDSTNDKDFKYQNANGGSYVYNLKTAKVLVPGDYELGFRVGDDPTIHVITFAIR